MRNGITNIQDFILNLAEYHRGGGEGRLPFVLILGVATTAAVIHRALPHPVSKLLAIEKFSGQGRNFQNLDLNQIPKSLKISNNHRSRPSC